MLEHAIRLRAYDLYAQRGMVSDCAWAYWIQKPTRDNLFKEQGESTACWYLAHQCLEFPPKVQTTPAVALTGNS